MTKQKNPSSLTDIASDLTPPVASASVAPADRFSYADVRNPVRQANGILCEVKFDANPDYWLFLAAPYDPETHGRAIYAECVAGHWGDVSDYFPTEAEFFNAATERIERALHHASSAITKYQDRIDIDDASATDIACARAWKIYRVDLHRLPRQNHFPHRITWPIAPDAPAD
ncbi:tail fiber assembly protein [Glaciimonas sp. PCH181]|uniref:tail fiber assembly protein n=1 Tax=Glaciimonas sp. PCH181 TaxID=2133943 RepID=UPI00137535E3|nr:tail fiber assembly protein [Glaciimonas sp. PCH181]